MKVTAYLTVFFLMIVMLSCVGELGFSSNNSKIIENNNQGNITLFSQNYSEVNSVPSNIFIGKIENTTTLDYIYLTIYGEEKSEILLENTSKELEYTTTRNSPLIPYSLLSDIGINYVEERTKKGSLYICNLTPMFKCTYEISMGVSTDDKQSYVELDSPGSKLIIHKIDSNTILKSYFQTDSSSLKSKTITISNADKSHFKIIFDGENKTNTIVAENGCYIITPFYDLYRQKLPYIDFSNGYIKFVSFIKGKGTYLDVNFSSINQKADRKCITPIGDSKTIAFGLDGPYPRNLTEQGINYLNSKGDRGTIWFDVGIIAECNQTDLEYLRNLVTNDSWEVGIHFSKELNSLPLDEAYKTIDQEYEYVYEKIGKKPTSWCSLRNRDNITHAIYAYNKLGMYWRNGDSGVEAEEMVGNLYDDTWLWWEPASHAGMTHPVFTHQTDKDPTIKYSISPSMFKTWVDTYYSNNVSIVPFYDYSLISRNTHDAYFDNISSNESFITFNAHTNGIKSLINVNTNAGNNTQVYDNTSDKYLDFKDETDKSITFWVENNHAYNVYLNDTGLRP